LSSVENISIVACLGKLMSLHRQQACRAARQFAQESSSLLFQPRRWGGSRLVVADILEGGCAYPPCHAALQRQLKALPTAFAHADRVHLQSHRRSRFAERLAAPLNLRRPAEPTCRGWSRPGASIAEGLSDAFCVRFAGATRLSPLSF